MECEHGLDRGSVATTYLIEAGEDIENLFTGGIVEIVPGLCCEGHLVEALFHGFDRRQWRQHADSVASVGGDSVLLCSCKEILVDGACIRCRENAHPLFAMSVPEDPGGSPASEFSIDEGSDIHRFDRLNCPLSTELVFKLGGCLRADSPVVLEAHARRSTASLQIGEPLTATVPKSAGWQVTEFSNPGSQWLSTCCHRPEPALALATVAASRTRSTRSSVGG